jgi:hypothetical protein
VVQKKCLFYIIAVFTVYILSGCAFPGKVLVDPDIPSEKNTIVIFESTIEIVEYNGVNVTKLWYPTGYLRKNTVTLPAGPATFSINCFARLYKTIVSIKDIELRFNFEAGKNYRVAAIYDRTGILGWTTVKIGVGIWDDAIGAVNEKETALRYWEFDEIKLGW